MRFWGYIEKCVGFVGILYKVVFKIEKAQVKIFYDLKKVCQVSLKHSTGRVTLRVIYHRIHSNRSFKS